MACSYFTIFNRNLRQERRVLKTYKVLFRGEEIGKFYFDFLIENKIIVELKKGDYFAKRNINQVKEYLKATGLKLAIIVNFTHHGIKTLRILNPNNKLTN